VTSAGRSFDVRRATHADAERLRTIAHDAKAVWGYDPELVRTWAASLDMTSILGGQELYVAAADGTLTDDALIAWAGLIPPVNHAAVLDHLWVDPAWMRRGVGSRLFSIARHRAVALGATIMEWGAEPNALGFYRAMGGRTLRTATSEWGRQIQIMGVDLAVRPNRQSSREGLERHRQYFV
jgi:GNAT superfamily N-acetyltransferase